MNAQCIRRIFIDLRYRPFYNTVCVKLVCGEYSLVSTVLNLNGGADIDKSFKVSATARRGRWHVFSFIISEGMYYVDK